MPHKNSGSIEPDDGEDDALINKLLNGEGEVPEDFSFGDTVGKVDDAVDYEDISDDDLLPEEEPSNAFNTTLDSTPSSDNDLFGMVEEGFVDEKDMVGEDKEGVEDCQAEIDFDDLFGDSDPVDESVLSNTETLDINPPADGLHDREAFIMADADMDEEMLGFFSDGNSSGEGSEMEISIQPRQEDLVKQYFPDFEPHKILSFNSLFRPKYTTLSVPSFNPPKVCVPTKVNLEMAPDGQAHFIKSIALVDSGLRGSKRIVTIHQEPEVADVEGENTEDGPQNPVFDRDLILACDDWESKLDTMMTTPPPPPNLKRPSNDEVEDNESGNCDSHQPKRLMKSLKNNFIDNLPDSWLDEKAIFEGNLTSICAKVTLDLNDPRLLIDIHQPNDTSHARRIGGEFRRRVKKDFTQRYNISNDEAYDLLNKITQRRVRSTLGQLEIEHSLPALKFQTPFYKEKLSLAEQRSYHRPTFAFDINQEYRFERLEHRKRKTYHRLPATVSLSTAKDLSLQDDLPFVLLEYSEEHPTVLSNFGMGSRIINYYRRVSTQDAARPKRDIGETQVLLSEDKSPFWNFGTVDPGEVVPTLYNGMFRAPIFQQSVKPTDFLVVRNTSENRVHHFLRTIPRIFAVGQLLPVTEIPSPHSRKVTTTIKNRLRMICYRILKHKRKDSKYMNPKDLAKHYPEGNEMQNRQKLKDVLERIGGGFWAMKPDEHFPTEESIRSLIKPEDLCLLEAMQVGMRNIADTGYSKIFDDEVVEDGRAKQQLEPWDLSKNFLEATQGKAMLELYGEGDPTGRGEAFSFVKTSMKGGFKAVGKSIEENMDQRLKELGGHKYNVARQEREYADAIHRIWQAQKRSLSCTEPPELESEDAQRDDEYDMPTPDEGKIFAGDETASQFTRASTINQGNKILRIKRIAINKKGEKEATVVTITDPQVIKQYVRRRRELDAEKTNIAEIVRTGIKEHDEINKRRLREELARLQLNKERRELRERQALRGGRSATPKSRQESGDGTPKSTSGKATTNRKCANCGQAGHIRTNTRVCPKLNGTWEKMGMSPTRVKRQRSESE
ncbi:hypothetical protein P167DRAFT_607773 [Morchella conica CCBAS932]|uniref:Transcription initiation factor TFIID subunit 1 histone acetyltransferase domain-containing protein n=1 Tax=Morchella conica CCBAS932 TaxID=1392247 RepID=A0A3N4KJY3_9PEZI|nr:hypothetical protein P167DRAFT_607773 [Morchella conica CCBAS932]